MSRETVGRRGRLSEVGDAETVRAVFEAMPVAMLGLEGPDHLIVAANAAYRAMARRSPLLGRTVAEAFPELKGQQIYEMYDRVYRTGVPQTAREWHLQLEPAGESGLTDIYFDFTVTPWRSARGKVIGATVYVEDVTDRVIERQVARQRAELAERRYTEAREVITTLQHELLPPGLPVLPGVRMAASYLVAETDTSAGGDWFDAVPLTGGRVALAVGDVVGHGVAASATMGQLRAVLQDHLAETGEITPALEAVDRLARRAPAARAATVCVAVLDPDSGSMDYCTAGHPPPLLVPADGRPRYLPSTGSGPLGGDTGFIVYTAQLDESDLVMLYSDGIIERPGRDHAGSMVELAEVAADAAADRVLRGSGLSTAERVCTQTLELLVRATGYGDDITLLVAQRATAPEPLRMDLPAHHGAITIAYGAVAAWSQRLGVGEQDVSALRHAVCELVTNSVEHAYHDVPEPGLIHLAGDLDGHGVVTVEVADEGHWREPRPDTEGLPGGVGLVVAEQFVDNLHVERWVAGAAGTTATIRHAVSTPGRLLTADRISSGAIRPARPEAPEELRVVEQQRGAEPRVRLAGPVTALTTAQLAMDLQRLTRNGTRSLTVDLSEVTVLASVGVAALQHAVRRSTEHGTELRLYAPPGSSAQHVLAVTALAHLTADPHASGRGRVRGRNARR